MSITMCLTRGQKTSIFWVCFFAAASFLFPTHLYAETNFSILITSNLQGKFSLELENQDTTDPMLVLGQNIVADRNQGAELYLDLGNALYPGSLSKYSSGAIMVDFLDYFSCAALLISSKDLQVGAKNLEFMQQSKNIRFVSANIMQEGKPLFAPWFSVDIKGTRVAFLGISSPKVRFDMAEKELYDFSLAEAAAALAQPIAQIQAEGIEHLVLLSGHTLRDTAQILETYPQISLALCGGDYSDRFLGGKAARIDLTDGRSIVMAANRAEYYHLKLVLGATLKVETFEAKQIQPIPTNDFLYAEFKNRLTLWKEKFLEEEGSLVAELSDMEYGVNDLNFAHLLRDRFNCELGVVAENTINRVSVKEAVRRADFLSMVNRDYNVFVLSLTGAEIKKVSKHGEELVIAGLEEGEQLEIQGTAVAGSRHYRIAASQLAMQKMQRLLKKRLDYSNTWMTVTELLVEDLKEQQTILRQDFDYLDRRFRTTIDASLSNFIEDSNVTRGKNIDTPSGQPSKSYTKWGLENSIDFTLYNKYHRFVFTPYMFYSRQDERYLKNILRGTLLYEYNLSDTYKPYNKLRYDTVVKEENGLRPSFLRETMGISAEYKYFNGKLGLGFEQQLQDPSEAAMYGVELIIDASFPFLSHFTYTFDLDTFTGALVENGSPWQTRSEINNGISAAINSYMSVSFRHKYFFYNEGETGERYQSSQFITSLDFKKNWKFW